MRSLRALELVVPTIGQESQPLMIYFIAVLPRLRTDEEEVDMRAKAARVRDRIRERIKARRVPVHEKPPHPKTYRVVAISLYSEQADSVDLAARELLRAGFRRPSRSL